MFGMLRAIGRLFRSLTYRLIGITDEVNKQISSDPNVIRAKYDEVIRQKGEDITRYIDAVGQMTMQKETAINKLKKESQEIIVLENQKFGAIQMAKNIAKGRSEEEIKQNSKDWIEYNKCKNFHRDYSTTVEEKKKRVADLTSRVAELDEKLAGHMTSLTSLKRDFDKLKTEQADSVARIISATQERKLNDTLNDLSRRGTSDHDLSQMRDLVAEAEAGAKVSGQIAGTDVARSVAQFEAAAAQAIANDEFASLVGVKPIQNTHVVTDVKSLPMGDANSVASVSVTSSYQN